MVIVLFIAALGVAAAGLSATIQGKRVRVWEYVAMFGVNIAINLIVLHLMLKFKR